ncbi:NAD-dependent succinate-semialdehyde dehydrogenase [uncultured Nisaea sp.]|uniref:NAD-dependent succinate-semialdehyde dehydrogenase n=1 Tax=uncultured Nisaea sp. TaxID=538215 RepID=UPI0030ED906B|tara:strand:- start:10538 stop:12010 length:1473 start_codon:yes stop_codon:yes gene_type:complete
MDIRSKLSDPSLLCEQGYIDGAWVDADGGGRVDVTDPATGDVVGTIPDMGADETRRAIEAANAAWPAWRAKTAKERSAILRKWFDLMMENQRDLGIIMTAEQGKPLAEAMGEIAYGASYVEFYAEEAKRIYGDIIPNTADGKRIVVLKQPVGVVGSITPWNFPNAMITRKAAPALAAGCTFVAKPAKMTPFSAIALAVLAERAGIPKGVFNVVCGASSSAIGNELTHSKLVRKITFTGSTEVGKTLIAQSASTVKKVSMELGGNAPLIIFDDADIDEAVKGAIICKYRNAGQTCVCANRIFVQDGIYDEFAKKFAAAAKAMKMGNGFDDGVTVGPLIEAAAVDKVEEHVQDAVAKGAKVAAGGARSNIGALFYEPTVLTGATRDMAIFREETFGPVAPLFRFKTEEEVIELANDTEFGLASYFYARDLGRVWRVAEALEYGMVAINEGILSSEVAPFGGVKESGLGREGSKYGLDDYLELKYLLMGGLNG